MVLEFAGRAIEWRGPAPYVFVPLLPDLAVEVREVAARASYGWGVIPVHARIGKTDFKTSLFPREGGYLVPIKVAVQRAEGIGVGSVVEIRLEIVLDR